MPESKLVGRDGVSQRGLVFELYGAIVVAVARNGAVALRGLAKWVVGCGAEIDEERGGECEAVESSGCGQWAVSVRGAVVR